MKKQHPTPEMVADLMDVFKKHNWNGQPIGLAQPAAIQAHAASSDCPNGGTPTWVSYQLPNGDTAVKKVCQ
jgi:hypothetical protein